jgi:Na+/H+ antiporter
VDILPAGFEVLLLCLPLAAAAEWTARRIGVPCPVLLVGAGMLLGMSGWPPAPDLSPSVVFYVFLPPLVYYAAYFIAPTDLRVNARSIGLLAVGLVVVTMAGVAGVLAILAPGVPLSVAAVAGAVVAPTDPVAATSVFRRLSVPERLVTVVEGEGLINDGTALVLYVTAVTAATGMVRPSAAAWALLAAPVGGATLGWAIAWLLATVRGRLDEPLVEIALSLATPYLTYALAEACGLSGILATVTAGVYVGSRTGSIYAPGARLQAFAFLDVLVFLLNAVLFTLVGMQLVRVVHPPPEVAPVRVVAAAAAVTAVVVSVRLAWMLTGPAIARLLRRPRAAARWRERLVVGWTGMRGGVSLAAALAVPFSLPDGSPFPYRDLVIVIAAVVIVATLVLQGTTLPLVLRLLRVGREDHRDEERQVRLHAVRAALAWLDTHPATGPAESLRALYAARAHRLQMPGTDIGDGIGDTDNSMTSYRALRLILLDVERSAVLDWQAQARVSAMVLRTIERSLDLEEARIRGS